MSELKEWPRTRRKINHHVHIDVATLARELTLKSYDACMQNNVIWKQWQELHPGYSKKGLENAYVARYLAAHVAPARSMLAGMLAQPGDEGLKQRIKDALIADNFLVRGRNPSGWIK